MMWIGHFRKRAEITFWQGEIDLIKKQLDIDIRNPYNNINGYITIEEKFG
jgi:hypothetical protein